IYTDGASEVQDEAGTELGSGGLAATLAECRGRTAAATLDTLLERIGRHGGNRPMSDDVTLLLVDRTA
ncbi:MAG: serine/threonine-protein phosphatase, partial [Acidobacteriota bacterium]|nr:serine/threonine-protein phosphatase [Acidobacteriota bacterium]